MHGVGESRAAAATAGAALDHPGGCQGVGRAVARPMAVEPELGLNALRVGGVEQWLRRGPGDAQLATRVEELVRHRNLDASGDDSSSEVSLAMRAIALLDPLAPLCWRGLTL